MSPVEKASKDVIAKAKKGEYVKRVRAGDQVAGGIMATIRDEAEKGVAWAKEAHFWNLDYAKHHPVSSFGAFRPAAKQLKAVVNRSHAPPSATPHSNVPGAKRTMIPGMPTPHSNMPGAAKPPGAPTGQGIPSTPSASTPSSSTPNAATPTQSAQTDSGGSSSSGSGGGSNQSNDSGSQSDSGITSDDTAELENIMAMPDDGSPDVSGFGSEIEADNRMLYILSKLDELGGNEALIVGAVIMANGPPLNDARIHEICSRLNPSIASKLCEGILQCFGYTEDEVKRAGQCIGQARRLQIVRLPDAPIKVFNPKVAKELGEHVP